MSEKVTVRTTFRPDLDVEMTATEAEDLRRQDLLVQPDQPESKAKGGAIRPAGAKGESA